MHCTHDQKRAIPLTFDFDGSDPQTATYGMATRAGTVGAVATLMLCLFGSGIAWNHGLMRPVKLVARDGSLRHGDAADPGQRWRGELQLGGDVRDSRLSRQACQLQPRIQEIWRSVLATARGSWRNSAASTSTASRSPRCISIRCCGAARRFPFATA